jgi:phosphosulfolactate phosphohydrolase-like enzyme
MMKVNGMRLQKGLIQKMITQSLAAKHLATIGYGDDVKFITQIDKYALVPLYRKGLVTCLGK